MTAQKGEFLEQMKKQYDELNYRWSRERDKFEADLQHESADIRKEYEAKREDYRKYRKELEEKIVGLDVASDKAWEDLKDGAEKSWNALNQAFDKASSHFKK
jgi:hypothetical protein